MIDNFKRHPLQPIISACVPLAIVGAALFGPANGPASASVPGGGSGGTAVGGTLGRSITTPATTAPGTSVTTADPAVRLVGGFLSVTGGGITLQAPQSGLLHGTVSFTGTVAQARPGETVTIERQGSLPGDWVPAASAVVGSAGGFNARWQVTQSGSLSVRAVLGSPNATDSSTTVAGFAARSTGSTPAALATTPALTLTVYRTAIATLYGPGLYGRRTACGERLTRATIGVANRALRCGSMVAIYYAGRELVVPVIDRGPYARGAVWDLTMATARAIGMTATAKVGALWPPPAN